MLDLREVLSESGIDLTSDRVRAVLAAAAAMSEDTLVNTLARAAKDNTSPFAVLARALQRRLAVDKWSEFTKIAEEVFEEVKATVREGKKVNYIPILETQDAEMFGVSICTVDGQCLNLGNYDVGFTLQSCVKPMMYSVAVESMGAQQVHKYVGCEPSGLEFNDFSFNYRNVPYNPMINTGAIVVGSCLSPGLEMHDRFKGFMDKVSGMAGGAHVEFSEATYLSERETCWRNNALKHLMEGAGQFPAFVSSDEALDFYTLCCSVEVTTQSAAVIAATLANSGVCPLTGETCLSASSVQPTLTLMLSCGMNGYSGEWCNLTGLPAKSGVAGGIMIVVPNVMGIAVFSPRLNEFFNSARGTEFCNRLFQRYPCGVFDNIFRKQLSDKSESPKSSTTGTGTPVSDSDWDAARSTGTVSVASMSSQPVTGASSVSGPVSVASSSQRHRHTVHAPVGQPPDRHGIAVRRQRHDRLHASDDRDAPAVPSGLKTTAGGTIPGFAPGMARAQSYRGTTGKVSLQLCVRTRHVWRALGRLHKNLLFVGTLYDVKGADAVPILRRGSKPPRAAVSKPVYSPSGHEVAVGAIVKYLQTKGIVCGAEDTDVLSLLELMQSASPGYVSTRSVLVRPAAKNIVVRALLCRLAVPDFEDFVRSLQEMYEEVKATVTTLSFENRYIRTAAEDELVPIVSPARDCQEFEVSGCTVDGQRFWIGPSGVRCTAINADDRPGASPSSCSSPGAADAKMSRFPLLQTVMPMLYALTLQDCGKEVTQEWVAAEPTAATASSFTLKKASVSKGKKGKRSSSVKGSVASAGVGTRTSSVATSVNAGSAVSAPTSASTYTATVVPVHPRPFHPYMDSGALVVCALLGRGHLKKCMRSFDDTGASSRFTHVLKGISNMAGQSRVGFSQPSFLTLKQRALKPLAIAHYMMGMKCFPPTVKDPSVIAQLYLQSCAIEMTTDQLAVVASTLACLGTCPTTSKRCIEPALAKLVLSTLYSCGMTDYAGEWNFHVGIPATCGSSGAHMVVVPNKLGLAIFQPELNRSGVSPKAELFCRLLAAKYRINLFDTGSVQGSTSVRMGAHKRRVDVPFSDDVSWQRTNFFRACAATLDRNVDTLVRLLRDGVRVSGVDADGRTLLHFSVAADHAEICKLLIDAGASPLAKDRDNVSPHDLALRSKDPHIRALFGIV